MDKSGFQRAFQIESESPHLTVVMINERWNVSLQVVAENADRITADRITADRITADRNAGSEIRPGLNQR